MSKYQENPCPKILYADEFKQWMKSIDEKSIQSWTTEDWLQIYEKIEDCTQKGYQHKGLVWEKYQKKFQNNQISEEEFNTIGIKIDNPHFLRKEFVEECEAEFVKLYKNYRMEPKHYSISMKKGKEIGQHLAQIGDIDCSAVAFDMRAREDAMETINVLMLKAAYDIDKHEEFEQLLAQTTITNKQNVSSSSVKGIEIEGSVYDSSLKTMGHEGTHYYFQTTAKWMRNLLEQGITAKEIPYDFAKLLRMNAEYYLNSESKKDISALEQQEQKKYQCEAFEGYRKQPVEKHANIMGWMMEHTYRNLVNQYSERNSLKLYPYIEDTLGTPYKTTHNGKSVTFEHHKTPYLGIAQVVRGFKDLPPKILEDMNIRENQDSIAYDIPEKWPATKEIENFLARKEKEYAEADTLQGTVMQAIQQKKQGCR